MAKVAVYFLLGIALLFGYIKYIESKAIYLPTKGVDYYPDLAGLAFEDIDVITEDGLRINGWFVPGKDTKYTVLFCHGNGGNIGHRMEKLVYFYNLGLSSFIIDYRGYGKSQGSPSEKGLYADARAAYDYLLRKRKIPAEAIILYGESLGSAVVIHLAAEEKVGGLIIEGGFSRGRDMAKAIYPFLPSFLFADSFDSLAKIGKVKAPKLFMHSKDDEVVPFILAKKLYDAADNPKHFAQLRGGHNSVLYDSQESYLSVIKSFIEKELSRKGD
ncbi:MAG: alpha/beta hydrolase [Candidatus Omnitrophica bacterium]|nr:alpha/beta hydrolase [Candidatus Omnitrophota bacterium]